MHYFPYDLSLVSLVWYPGAVASEWWSPGHTTCCACQKKQGHVARKNGQLPLQNVVSALSWAGSRAQALNSAPCNSPSAFPFLRSTNASDACTSCTTMLLGSICYRQSAQQTLVNSDQTLISKRKSYFKTLYLYKSDMSFHMLFQMPIVFIDTVKLNYHYSKKKQVDYNK